MQDIEVPLDAASRRIAAVAYQGEPPREPQHRQRPRDRFVGGPPGVGTWRRGEIGAHLLITGERADAAIIQLHAKDLPCIALERRQSRVGEQRTWHTLVTVAGVK